MRNPLKILKKINSFGMKSLIFNGKQTDNLSLDIEHLFRGFYYSDGFFETMYFDGKNLRNKAFHIERIKKAINTYEFITEKDVTSLLDERLAFIDTKVPQRIKWTFWRKGKGTYLAEQNEVNELFEFSELKSLTIKLKSASIYKKFKVPFSPISRFKTLECSVYNFAARYMDSKNLDDVILLGKHQAVCEALYSNLFWINGDTVYTPAITTGCIDGTMRNCIIDYLDKKNIKVESGHYSPEELFKADVVFTTNALKIEYITNIDNHSFGSTHSIVEDIRQQLVL